MKIVSNWKLIRRNALIGRIASIATFVTLGIGMYVSFTKPELIIVSLGALILGFILMQVGMNFSNRFGRQPRPDELIDRSLKGLDREYTMYHYATPASHFLVGPAGLWILLVYHQAGTVTFDKGRWRQKGGGFAQAYLRVFGQESIGNPVIEAEAEIRAIARHLKRLLPETELPDIQSALLFVNPKVNLEVEGAPIPTFTPKGLKDHFRQQAKQKKISTQMLATIREHLPEAEKEEG